MSTKLAIAAALLLATLPSSQAATDLRTSANRRYLETSDGKPFLWLGTTEWVLNTHTDDQIRTLLDRRKAQGFTVVQVFAARSWGQWWTGDMTWSQTDAKGNKPFVDGRPTQLTPEYWNRWRWIVDEAAKRGLRFLIMVGEPGRNDTPWRLKTHREAYDYGRAVGEIFKDKPTVIFSISQDTEGNTGIGIDGFRAIAEGVADGVNGQNSFDNAADYSTTFMTYHPWTTTSAWFPKDTWVDANGIQGSRNEAIDNNLVVYARVGCEYGKTEAVRPVLFLEGSYEGERNGGGKHPPTTPRNVRMQAWYAFFAGAAGYSYGHINNWDQYKHIDYLDSPGALQMGVVGKFLSARKWWTLVPDQTILTGGEGSGETRKVALRAADGNAAYVFYPTNSPASVRLSALTAGGQPKASWFDPRDGQVKQIGNLTATQASKLRPPEGWEDAILVIEAGTK